MNPSAKRAFCINELLEMILLELDDPMEIIRAKRVCRAWRYSIQNSQKLQQACWYQAQRPNQDDNEMWRLNPTFKKLFKIDVLDPTEISRLPEGMDEEMLDFPVDPCEWGLTSIRENGRQNGVVYEQPINREVGSWATMLASQPPCQWMVMAWWDDEGVMWPSLVYARDPVAGGLLMGDVMTAITQYVKLRLSESFPWSIFDMEFYPVTKTEVQDSHFVNRVETLPGNASITVGWKKGYRGNMSEPSGYFEFYRTISKDEETPRGSERVKYRVVSSKDTRA